MLRYDPIQPLRVSHTHSPTPPHASVSESSSSSLSLNVFLFPLSMWAFKTLPGHTTSKKPPFGNWQKADSSHGSIASLQAALGSMLPHIRHEKSRRKASFSQHGSHIRLFVREGQDTITDIPNKTKFNGKSHKQIREKEWIGPNSGCPSHLYTQIHTKIGSLLVLVFLRKPLDVGIVVGDDPYHVKKTSVSSKYAKIYFSDQEKKLNITAPKEIKYYQTHFQTPSKLFLDWFLGLNFDSDTYCWEKHSAMGPEYQWTFLLDMLRIQGLDSSLPGPFLRAVFCSEKPWRRR